MVKLEKEAEAAGKRAVKPITSNWLEGMRDRPAFTIVSPPTSYSG